MGTSDRRGRVMVGELPADFLRLPRAEAPPQQHQQIIYASPAAFVPANTRGRLSITIVSARLAKNYGLVRMDPYARLRVGPTFFETPTDVSGAKAPRWNRTIHAYLPNGVDSVLLEIFDERAFSEDERVAWATIPIPQPIFSMEPVDDWFHLSGKEGEGKEGMANLIFSFAPLEQGPIPYTPMYQPGAQQQRVGAGGVEAVGAVGGAGVAQLGPDVDVNAGPLFTDADVAELGEMFPAVEAEVIKSVLFEKRGNKDATVNALLLINAD